MVRGDRALPRPARAAAVRLQPADAQPARHPREPARCATPTLVAHGRPRGSPSRPRSQSGVARAGRAAAAADVHAVPPARPGAARTASSSRRCASTRPRTARSATGTSCTSAAARIGGAGLVMTEMTDVSRDGRITPGCTGMYKPEHVDGVEAHRRLRARHSAGEDRHPARPRRPQGLDAAAVGGDDEPLAEGNWPLDLRLAASLLPAQPGAARDGPRATWTRCATTSCAPTSMAERGRLRPARAAHRARLPAGDLHLAADQPARPTSTAAPLENRDALPARGLRRGARRVARGEADLGAHLGDRLGAGRPRRPTTRSRSRARCKAHGCDIVDVSAGQTVPDAAARLRPPVPDAVRRPHPPRGRHRRR